MGDPVQKSGKDGELLMDFCSGICSTVKPCILLDQHRKFAGCDVNPEVLSAADPEFLLTLAS